MSDLVVVAPVAARGWALERWFECLERQTMQPDAFAFVFTETGDDTLAKLDLGLRFAEVRVEHAPEQFVPRERRNQGLRYAIELLAMLRNRCLANALRMGANIIFSLDTDIFLTDPTTIEQLVTELDFLPLSAPMVNLSPIGPCFNAADWMSGEPGPTRAWQRYGPEDLKNTVPLGGPVQVVIPVDIPMAAVMMRRWVAEGCSYGYHEAGEDMGFAQSLDRHGFRCAWRPDLLTTHVMDPAAELPA